MVRRSPSAARRRPEAIDRLRLAETREWLIDGARTAQQPPDVLRQLSERLVAARLPLDRVAVFVRMLHPNVVGRRFIWRSDRPVELVEVPFTSEAQGREDDTLRAIFEAYRPLRRRIADPACPDDLEVVRELRPQGFSDYYALPLEFSNGEVHVLSFATRRRGGFSRAAIVAFDRLRPAMARIAEIYALRRLARNVVDTYLGPFAGGRVLAGQIKRGDAERIHAVIWYCDLRDSTALANAIGPEAFLAVLNAFFEATAGCVLAEAGAVLRFVGDAALAIFPIPPGSRGARRRAAFRAALRATRAAEARISRLNADRRRAGETALAYGIGLHMGDVLYGNVGAATRLEFTVVGAAAHEAARLLEVCRRTDRSAVLSDRFVEGMPGRYEPLGEFALRGVGRRIAAFGLPAARRPRAQRPVGKRNAG